MKQTTLTFLLLLTFCLSARAQMFKMLTADNQLSSSMVNTIYQDREGEVWIGSQNGLTRYNGAAFRTYRENDLPSRGLINSYVNALYEDRQGHLFIGTLKGLQVYDRATDYFQTIPADNKEKRNISSIIQRSNGDLLAASIGGGLYRIIQRDGQFYAHYLPKFSPSKYIYTIYEDKHHTLWVLTNDNGIFCYPRHGRAYHFPESVTSTPMAICQDNKGTLYVGSQKGLYQYNYTKHTFLRIPLPDNVRTAITSLHAKGDKLLIGTDGNGLLIYQPSTHHFRQENIHTLDFDLQRSKVHAITQDRQGNYWLGLFQKGVIILPKTASQFQYIGYKSATQNIIGSCCIMSIASSQDGTIWIGTDNDGLYGIGPDGHQRAHFAPSNSGGAHTISPTVMAICADSRGSLWLGFYQNGLARINPSTGYCDYIHLPGFTKYRDAEHVFSIVEDHHQHLWIGTHGGGLYRLDLTTNKVIEANKTYKITNKSINYKFISCLLPTRDDHLYIGTYDGLGCLNLRTGKFNNTYKGNRFLRGQTIYCLKEDRQGIIWIGTTRGLYQLNPRTHKIRHYGIADGLPSTTIASIEEDAQEQLWISTQHGLSCLNRQRTTFYNYYAGDGLQGNEFSNGASCAIRDLLFFGGTGGVTYFRPGAITPHAFRPDIRIINFYVNNQAVHAGMQSGGKDIIDCAVEQADHFHLSYHDNSFSIEFSAMQLYSPERIVYEYSMDDDAWIALQPGVNRVSFVNLSSGAHHFRVRARNNDSYSPIREITVIITPPWYASWWAYTLYLLLFITAIVLYLRYRQQRYEMEVEIMEQQHHKQMNEARLQMFTDITHEIRTPMTLIMSPLEKLMAIDHDDVRHRYYLTIYHNAERILALVNQMMDIRKIERGQMQLQFTATEIVAYIRDICHSFEYQAQNRGIDFHFHTEISSQEVWIDPHHFDKVIINVLSNAFKYTPKGGRVDVKILGITLPSIENHNGTLTIVISDTGTGIRPEDLNRIFDRFYQGRRGLRMSVMGTGVGLHLTRSLMDLHHGTITAANNTEGPGCHFTITLPLGHAHLKSTEMVTPTRKQISETQGDYDNRLSDDNSVTSVSDEDPTARIAIDALSPAVNVQDCQQSKTRYHVLVVEDDEETRRYICEELGADFHMHECNNGEDALNYVLRQKPDLVISDVMMPGMDGFTLCSKIKHNINVNETPVILLTAKTQERDNIEGLAQGADAYITKPFSVAVLRSTCFNLIRIRLLLRHNYSGQQEQQDKVEQLELDTPDKQLMDRIMKVINENMSNQRFTVEMLADKVGISRVHLHRKMKELTSQTTRDFIKNVRLRQAAQLLKARHQNISEVAYMTGFTSATHFSTAFKLLYGVTPTEYMNESEKTDNV